MAREITMPKLSDTMEEGKILRWLKRVGDEVRAGDVIAEVETDKADMELEASESGILAEIKAKEGDNVSVGAVVAVLGIAAEASRQSTPEPRDERAGEAGEAGKAREAKEERQKDRSQSEAADGATEEDREGERRMSSQAGQAGQAGDEASVAGGDPVRASPLARRIAEGKGIDLHQVRGTGPEGRVTRRDVEGAGAGLAEEPGGSRRVELSKMRQTIARRMAEAKREIPHFYLTVEICMSKAVEALQSIRKHVDEHVTATHLILKATARALVQHPRVNGRLLDGAVEIGGAVNVGVAVAVEDGLVVPVIHHCEQLSLPQIAAETRRLVDQARAGRFSGDDLKGATFSVSNLGMLDVDEFSAVINAPQAAILAVGAIKDRPVVRDGQLAVGKTMRVTLSCDHRQINGVEGGRFLETLKGLLESPIVLLLE